MTFHEAWKPRDH